MRVPPFLNYTFDVTPKEFADGAVESLVGATIEHPEYGAMHVESSRQSGVSTAELVLKPGEGDIPLVSGQPEILVKTAFPGVPEVYDTGLGI